MKETNRQLIKSNVWQRLRQKIKMSSTGLQSKVYGETWVVRIAHVNKVEMFIWEKVWGILQRFTGMHIIQVEGTIRDNLNKKHTRMSNMYTYIYGYSYIQKSSVSISLPSDQLLDRCRTQMSLDMIFIGEHALWQSRRGCWSWCWHPIPRVLVWVPLDQHLCHLLNCEAPSFLKFCTLLYLQCLLYIYIYLTLDILNIFVCFLYKLSLIFVSNQICFSYKRISFAFSQFLARINVYFSLKGK